MFYRSLVPHLKHLLELPDLFGKLPKLVSPVHLEHNSVHIPYFVEFHHIIQWQFQAFEETHQHFLHKKIDASFLIQGLYLRGRSKDLSEGMPHEVNRKPTEKPCVKVGQPIVVLRMHLWWHRLKGSMEVWEVRSVPLHKLGEGCWLG